MKKCEAFVFTVMWLRNAREESHRGHGGCRRWWWSGWRDVLRESEFIEEKKMVREDWILRVGRRGGFYVKI